MRVPSRPVSLTINTMLAELRGNAGVSNMENYERTPVHSDSKLTDFSSAISSESWQYVYNSIYNINKKYTIFISIFLRYFYMYFPKRKICTVNRKAHSNISEELLYLRVSTLKLYLYLIINTKLHLIFTKRY